jgi:predicted transposase/invertase (TIGR01784 family)
MITAYTDGEIKGKAIGLEEGKIETAIKMLADGMAIENVCKYTGLSEEQVRNFTG